MLMGCRFGPAAAAQLPVAKTLTLPLRDLYFERHKRLSLSSNLFGLWIIWKMDYFLEKLLKMIFFL